MLAVVVVVEIAIAIRFLTILITLKTIPPSPICEVKQGQVGLVLAWGTSWEVPMLYIFALFCIFFVFFSLSFFVFLGKAGNHMIMVIQFDGG